MIVLQSNDRNGWMTERCDTPEQVLEYLNYAIPTATTDIVGYKDGQEIFRKGKGGWRDVIRICTGIAAEDLLETHRENGYPISRETAEDVIEDIARNLIEELEERIGAIEEIARMKERRSD